MTRTIIVVALLLGMAGAASAADGLVNCTIQVLESEELPGAPISQNLVKATLLVTAPGSAPFQTTVVKLIPWQVPPPRQGQKLTVPCDPASLSSFGFNLRIF